MTNHSLYISSSNISSGAISIVLGFMQLLKTKFHKVAFYKPIVKDKKDTELHLVKEYFSLKIDILDMYSYDLFEFEDLVSKDSVDIVISTIIDDYSKLLNEYDFILLQGINKEYLISYNSDINLTIAKNLSIPFINVFNGYKKEQHLLLDEIKIQQKELEKNSIEHFATFINKSTFKFDNRYSNLYYLPYIKDVDDIIVNDVYHQLKTKLLFGEKKFLNKTIKNIKVISMTLENCLKHIEDQDLIIVSGDRIDIISGLLLLLKSKNLSKISGIILSGNIKPKGIFKELLKNFEDLPIVILSTKYDTYKTAFKISNIKPVITSKNYTKISLLLGAFSKNIDHNDIDKFFEITYKKDIITPLMFEYNLFNIAKQNRQHIVLPESNDDRVLRATEIVLNQHIVNITLLGDKTTILHRAKLLGLNISKANIIDPKKSSYIDEFTKLFFELRKNKGLLISEAKDIMQNDKTYFATMMVHLGYANGMVSGASTTTANTVRPALQIIKTTKNIDIVSSVFFMCLDTKVLVFADCAINPNPNEEQLAQIALSSVNTAKAFGIEPKVAMLSYSTGNSGSGDDVQKVLKATNIVKNLDKTLKIEGPIQYDAAIDKTVAKKKLPNSTVAGDASILIFPDLNSGNNTYKAVQRSSGAVAIGPILQGLNKPVNDLSRGCSVKDIINTIAITAIQVQGIKNEYFSYK